MSASVSASDSASNAPPYKRSQNQGPCYLKMLVSNLVAGSIIGKSGSVIAHIETTTGVTMKLSTANQFFPGTTDRIVVMSGELENIDAAVRVILDKIGDVTSAQFVQDSEQNKNGQLVCKIVVPKSAVSGIIGKGGQQIQQLQGLSGAKIKISDRGQGLRERVVTISGTLDSITEAALQVARDIQEDPYLQDYMTVTYHAVVNSAPMQMSGSPTVGQPGSYSQYMPASPSASAAMPYPFTPPFHHHPQVPSSQIPSGDMESLMNEHCEVHLEVPDNCIGPVIGKNGMYLMDIMRSTNAVIKLSQKGDLVPGTNMRKVAISGALSSVHRAHARIIRRVREVSQSGFNSMPRSSDGGSSQGIHHLNSPPHFSHVMHHPTSNGGAPYGGYNSHYNQMSPSYPPPQQHQYVQYP